MICFGEVPAGAVLPIYFDSFAASTGAPITITGLATSDIEVVKGTSVTPRSSDAGYALLDTDGIDIGSRTGIHGFTIDTGDNTDSGFYAVGSFFTVLVDAVTIDSQTVRFVAATFRIKAAEATAGKAKVDVDLIEGSDATDALTAAVPTAAAIADAVWEEDIYTHSGTPDSAAEALIAIPYPPSASTIANTVWSDLVSNYALSDGSTGKALGDIPTAAANASAVAAVAVDGSTTLAESLRLSNSALGGKASGLGTTSVAFRDLADTKDRITATVDTSGNRTAVTRDLA